MNCLHFRGFAALLIACTLGAAAAAADDGEWTRFRGPNGQGVSNAEGIPTTWTGDDYNWVATLPGVGHSSPVIWGNRLFLTSALEENAQRVVVCIDTATGAMLWERRFDSDVHHHHLRNSFASSTPAVDEKHVYLAWTTPEEYTLMALDHNGRDAWKVDLGPYDSQHSHGTSPIVYRDMVIINNDQDGPSFLVALDRHTGEQRWRAPRESAVVAYSTPCVRRLEDGSEELVFCSQAHGINGVDPTTGATNWELRVFQRRSVSSPVLADGLIFGSCGSGGGGVYNAAVRPGSSPELVYKVEESGSYVPTPVYRDGKLFIISDKGIGSCIQVADGEELWRERLGNNFSGSPICVGDKLYVIAEDGKVLVLSATENFEILGENPLGEDSRATPAVAGGQMFLRTYSHLYAIGGK